MTNPRIVALAISIACLSSPVLATSWTGGGGNRNWSTPANWQFGVPPQGPGATASFAGPAIPTASRVDVPWTVTQLDFLDLAWTVTGTSPITFPAGGPSGIRVLSPATLAISAPVIFNTPATVEAGSDLILPLVGGNGGFAKLGGAQLTITDLAMTGPITIAAGTLEASPHGVNDLTVSPGATLVAGDSSWGSISGSGAIAATGTFTIGNGADATFNGAITGAATLVKVGPGSATLSGTNAWTNGVQVLGGTLTLANTFPTNATVLNQGSLVLGNMPFKGVGAISGSGSVTFNTGGYNQAGPWTHTGDTIIGNSVQIVALNLPASALRVTGDLRVNTGSVASLAGAGLIEVSGTVQHGASNADTVFTGSVEGSGELVKVGTGTFTMAGSISATKTTVQQGTFLLANSPLTGTTLRVKAGATLSGTGAAGRIVAIDAGAAVATSGLVKTFFLTFQGTLASTIGGSPASGAYGRLDAASVAFGPGATLSLSGAYVPVPGDAFKLVDNFGNAAVAGTFDGLPEGAIIVFNGVPLSITYAGGDGNDVVLTVVTQTVTASASGPGTISPSGLQSLVRGGIGSFTLVPSAHAHLVSATGTCGGSLAGNVYTTVAVSADCSVMATFADDSTLPALGLAEPTLAFGGQSMETTSPPLSLHIGNTGGSDLVVTGIAIDNAQFSALGSCAPIAPGATCTIAVSFSPAIAAGAINSTVPVAGLLTITSNAPGSPHQVALSGVGEKSLVTHYYRSILRRAPDAGGKAFWASEAEALPALGANINDVWYAMAQSFYSSAEYAAFHRDDAGFVTDLYNTFFDRPPDGAGLAYWSAQLGAGLPRESVLGSFMFSAEFAGFTQAIFGNTATRAEVDTVMDFYRGLLARLPGGDDLDFWVQRFRVAQCAGAAAVYTQLDAIADAFAGSAEYAARNRSTDQYVGDLYNAFLRRGGDQGGTGFWASQINAGALTRAQALRAFISTPEFAARVGGIVNGGCVD